MIIPLVQNERAGDKRERILDAALSLFAEFTFAGTAMPMVASRAAVGAGTIYRYFASKEELVNELYSEWKTTMANEVLAEVLPGQGPREEFGALWRGLARFAARHPDAYQFLEGHHHRAYLTAESAAAGVALETAALQFVRRAQRAGVIRRGDPAMLLAMVMGAFHGVFNTWVLPLAVFPTRQVHAAEEAAWSMLANPDHELLQTRSAHT